MSSISTIITHPGGAHKDEFLACCVLLALHKIKIIRREPTEEDLTDPSICVVDVGHLHEPEKNNFDHHQFPREQVPTCSLSLILQHLGLYQDSKQFCAWLEPAEWLDCRGPTDTAKWLQVERRVINQLNSPIDVTLLRRFASAERLVPGDIIWEMMQMVGEDLLGYVTSLRKRLDFIDQHSEFWDIENKGETSHILFMPRTKPLPSEPSAGLFQYIEGRASENQNVIGMIYPDRRGDGYGLSRFNDNLLLDFTRISEESDVHFAHARGFMAKTSATTPERLKSLMTSALGSE
jgi:hypothetical protein